MQNHDPDFGQMKYNGFSAWDCRINFQFPHPSSKYFAVHIWSNIAVHIGELYDNSIELVIELNLPDEGTKGYFISIENWSYRLHSRYRCRFL